MKNFRCILWLLMIIVLFSGCSLQIEKKEETIEDSLIGVWKTGIIEGIAEADIKFECVNDKYIGEYNIYDYTTNEWSRQNFELKSVENFTMTLLLATGKIEQHSFAVSKNTLYFAGFEFLNSEKNVVSNRTDTYIKDGVISPIIDDVFLGMTKEEFEKTDFIKECSKAITGYDLPDNYFEWYPSENLSNWVNGYYGLSDNCLNSLIFYFNYDLMEEGSTYIVSKLIDEYSSRFGDYAESSGRYTWVSGNLEIVLNTNTEHYYQVEYSLKS